MPHGRRLVATIARQSPGLWTVPIPDVGRIAHESDVKEYAVPKPQLPWAPRFAPEASDGSLYFLSSSGGSGAGLWRYRRETLTNVWKGSNGALFEPAVVSRMENTSRSSCTEMAKRSGTSPRLMVPSARSGNASRSRAARPLLRMASRF
jgi:hypothetical protein